MHSSNEYALLFLLILFSYYSVFSDIWTIVLARFVLLLPNQHFDILIFVELEVTVAGIIFLVVHIVPAVITLRCHQLNLLSSSTLSFTDTASLSSLIIGIISGGIPPDTVILQII